MPADPAILAALAEAVNRDPNSVPLRLHLAQLLLESGGEAAALEHYAAAVDRAPANREALDGAGRAAQAVGDVARADGYFRRLADLESDSREVRKEPPEPGLGTGPMMAPPPPPPSPPRLPTNAKGDGYTSPTPIRQPAHEQEGPAWWELEWSGVRLADVGGMEEVKRRLEVSFLGPARNPELRAAYGLSMRGGLLLYGPPGCGKTFIARATAGELGARFLPVLLSDVLDMWLGNSEKHVHEIFEAARRNPPCVIFLDEVDAIGQKRTHLRHSPAMRGVVNQLLAEMDGMASSNDGVFVLGATNAPWDVDPALLRPGRFDRMAPVLPPDQPARASILSHHLKGRPAAGIDLASVASRTDGLSGADLAHLCQVATEQAMEESLATGRVRQITMADFEKALRSIRPSTRPWFESARNYVLFANQAGLYDDLAAYMRSRRLL